MPKYTLRSSIPRTLSKKSEASSAKNKNERVKDDDQPRTKRAKAKEDVVETRAANDRKFIGAHVSIAGGIHKSVEVANEIGATAFALFLKSNHQWKAKPLDSKDVSLFKENCSKYNYPPHLIVPHACYLLNIAAPKEETLSKSRNAMIEEMQRCQELGLTLFNIHPGSTCGIISKEESIRRCAESVNMAHDATKDITVLVENMCGQGGTLGGDFQELKDIISGVKDKKRIGVCLDTCHAFAYGYNLATENGYEKMMTDLEDIIGMKYVMAVHLNDSIGDVASHLDRHANIGRGKIGKDGFTRIMNDKRFDNIPMVLETPASAAGYKDEISLLKNLIRD